ncbi:MAG: prephenate dehydratase [Saprospiraceae bacterium]|jgi:prephenate dehydratase|tara:strand:+ start:1444 stop:2286 length:843 start_codon:yes stop_codon:yes gene_type:complete
MARKRIAIQGYPGSFHDEVCQQYFGDAESIPAGSFDILAKMLADGEVDGAVMAIENSIAGTILQNYRILREYGFWIVGERYLRIKHNLLAYPGTKIEDIKEVHSHPMALNQCLKFLRNYPEIKLVETEDTALSALKVMENKSVDIASISSIKAAELYGLDVLDSEIETSKSNYTRFFIIERENNRKKDQSNKASIYIRIPDVKGQLLKVLQVIHNHDLNMSKLQSFPVLGQIREYFFHLDIEFDEIGQYENLKGDLMQFTQEYTELGIYEKDDIRKMLVQ